MKWSLRKDKYIATVPLKTYSANAKIIRKMDSEDTDGNELRVPGTTSHAAIPVQIMFRRPVQINIDESMKAWFN